MDYTIYMLEHARSYVKDDWRAYAILTEAILAFRYGYSDARVAKFARVITTGVK